MSRSGKFPTAVLVVAVCSGALAAASAWADTGDSPPPDVTVELEDLQLQSDPTFVLLGISPEKVDRPTDPSDVAISIRSATEDLSMLPTSYAIAFAPFWLTPRRSTTFSDWADASSFGDPILRALSLSMAAHTASEEDSGASITRLAFGLRTSLLQGRVDDAFTQRVDASVVALREGATRINDAIEKAEQKSGAIGKLVEFLDGDVDETSRNTLDALTIIMDDGAFEVLSEESVDAWRTYIGLVEGRATRDDVLAAFDDFTHAVDDQQMSAIQAELDEEVARLTDEFAGRLQADVSSRVPRRVGWNIDVAGALAWHFRDRIAESGTLESGAGWVNVSYSRGDWSFITTLRATGRDGVTPVYDIGSRLVLDVSPRISPSFEGVLRRDARDETDFAYSLIIESAVGSSKSLVFSFGRDFAPDLEDSVIATIQFVAGFGKAQTIGGTVG